MTPLVPSFSLSATLVVASAVVCGSSGLAAEATARRDFNLPADRASTTLRLFAEQAGTEVVFAADTADRVQTNLVRGSFTLHEAMQRLLAGTGLVAERSPRTGAFTIVRTTAPPKASLVPSPPTSPSNPSPAKPQTVTPVPMNPTKSSSLLLMLAGWFAAAGESGAQTASTPNSSAGDPVTLSPFVVSSEKDEGYQAQNTLSGSRLNASLANTPVAIQVLTKELLLDLNATNYEDFLNFATNSGRDFSDVTGLASTQNGNNQVRIRGFTGAAITRDFFTWPARADRFSLERYEVSRGPNSILFGIGGPGGVVNSSSKVARIDARPKDEVRATIGSWNNRRAELDFTRTLRRGQLAVRANFLFEDKDGWRDYEFEKRLGAALAATWQPWRRTQVRLNYEYVDTQQNQALPFPTSDTAGAWIAAGKPLAAGPIYDLGTPAPAGTVSSFNDAIRFAPQVSPNAYRYGDTRIVDALPNAAGAQRVRFFDTVNAPASSVGGQPSYLDFAVVPERANLRGPGNRSDNRHGLLSVFVEQRAGPVAVEFAVNRQESSWQSKFPLPWQTTGVRGDPNRELPGTYLPTGTLGANPPGQAIASPFAPNPFAGQFYVEGNASFRVIERTDDNFRATVSLDLDLRRRHGWLGRHQFAALAQRQETETYTDVFSEFNLSRDNALSFNATQNQIIRRTYVDFTTPGAPRGVHDPFAEPINSPGVQSGYLRSGQTNRQHNITDSQMAVVQSSFRDDFLVVTLGVRRDEQNNNRAGGGVLLPAGGPLGGTWTEDTVYSDAGKTTFTGNTRTFGAVIRPVKWAALVYNASNSVRPNTQLDIFGAPLRSQEGIGQDYGARFFVLDNRINLGVTRYNTDNTRSGLDAIAMRTQGLPVLTGIYQAFTDAGIAAKYRAGSFFDAYRDTADSDGSGWEVELTANPTKRWRLSANLSRADLKVANIQPITNALIAAETPFWRQNARVPFLTRNANVESFVRVRDNTPARDFALAPVTVEDARQFVQGVVDSVNLQEGQLPLQHQSDAINFFNSYSFPKLPLIGNGFTAGLGASYRSAAVVGYANNLPIYGRSYTIWNGMLRKRFTLPQQRTLDFQLNVNNLFREHDLLPFSATATGVERWFLQRQRQRWDLQMALAF